MLVVNCFTGEILTSCVGWRLKTEDHRDSGETI